MNFLMDRSAENWAKELARVKDQAGACTTTEPLTPRGAIAAGFRWTCEKGFVDGQILLAPTTPLTVQALGLRFVAR
jgi:hypothetical protein